MSVDGCHLVNKSFPHPQSQVFWYIKDIKHQLCWLYIAQFSQAHGAAWKLMELEVVREVYGSTEG